MEMGSESRDDQCVEGKLVTDEIEGLAHRTCSRYKHDSNPARVEYVFQRHTLVDFVRAIAGLGVPSPCAQEDEVAVERAVNQAIEEFGVERFARALIGKKVKVAVDSMKARQASGASAVGNS